MIEFGVNVVFVYLFIVSYLEVIWIFLVNYILVYVDKLIVDNLFEVEELICLVEE